jgi:hypothetical protein
LSLSIWSVGFPRYPRLRPPPGSDGASPYRLEYRSKLEAGLPQPEHRLALAIPKAGGQLLHQ